MLEDIGIPPPSMAYGVQGVPRIVTNEKRYFEGTLPEETYAGEVANAATQASS